MQCAERPRRTNRSSANRSSGNNEPKCCCQFKTCAYYLDHVGLVIGIIINPTWGLRSHCADRCETSFCVHIDLHTHLRTGLDLELNGVGLDTALVMVVIASYNSNHARFLRGLGTCEALASSIPAWVRQSWECTSPTSSILVHQELCVLFRSPSPSPRTN